MPTTRHRTLLSEELERRKRRNPAYSLRAFARDLGVSVPFLSQLLNGRRGIGRAKAAELAKRAGFVRDKRALFLTAVELSTEQDSAKAARLLARLERLERCVQTAELDQAAFEMTAEWHYQAILALTTCAGFRGEIPSIARRLNLPEPVVAEAVDRMLSLGLLVREKHTLRRTENFQTHFPKAPSAAVRAFHRNHLKKAADALDHQGLDEREFLGLTLSVSREQVPMLKERLRAFVLETLMAVQEGEHTDVYHLAVQLFRLTEP